MLLRSSSLGSTVPCGLVLIYPLGYLRYTVHRAYGVEVQTLHPVLHELAALLHPPLYAYLLHLLVCAALESLVVEGLGQVAVEGLGHHGELAKLGQGLDTRYDGDVDTRSTKLKYFSLS